MIYNASTSHYRGQSLATGSEIFLFINFPSELADKISCHLHWSASYITILWRSGGVGGPQRHKVRMSNISPASSLAIFSFTNEKCHKFRNIVTISALKYFIVLSDHALWLGGQLFLTFSIALHLYKKIEK